MNFLLYFTMFGYAGRMLLELSYGVNARLGSAFDYLLIALLCGALLR